MFTSCDAPQNAAFTKKQLPQRCNYSGYAGFLPGLDFLWAATFLVYVPSVLADTVGMFDFASVYIEALLLAGPSMATCQCAATSHPKEGPCGGSFFIEFF